VRLYGLCHWIKQSYKQIEVEFDLRDFMVKRDRAIRRHWALIFCVFTFWQWYEAAEVRLHEAAMPPTPARRTATLVQENSALLGIPATHRVGLVQMRWFTHVAGAGVPTSSPRPNCPHCLNISGLAVASTWISGFNKLPLGMD
jgi:hypothetical protein